MQLLLYNKEFIELLENFYTLTGIRVVLFDETYTELVSYPSDKITFCNTMKKNPLFCEKCAISDKSSFEKANARKVKTPQRTITKGEYKNRFFSRVI